MGDDEATLRELISYLSKYLDFSIREFVRSGKDIPEDDGNLKILYDILEMLQYLQKTDPNENTQ